MTCTYSGLLAVSSGQVSSVNPGLRLQG